MVTALLPPFSKLFWMASKLILAGTCKSFSPLYSCSSLQTRARPPLLTVSKFEIVFNLTSSGLALFYVFNIASILGVISHFRCAMSDPGEIPRDILVPPELEARKVPMCNKGCKTWKPVRAHHCSECKRCIMRVRFALIRWTTIALGSTTVWASPT